MVPYGAGRLAGDMCFLMFRRIGLARTCEHMRLTTYMQYSLSGLKIVCHLSCDIIAIFQSI